MAVEDPASFEEATRLPATPVEEADQMAATVAAETAQDYSKQRPKMTPATAVAAASDYVAIDPFVVLPGECWISQHLNLGDFVNYYSSR